MTRDDILALLADDEQVIFYEPPFLDVAIVGLSHTQPGRGVRCVVYDLDLLTTAYIDGGMSPEDAQEWISFNTLGAWLGDATPIVITQSLDEPT